MNKPRKVICGYCGAEYTGYSKRSRWCSNACKMKAARERWKRRDTVSNSIVTKKGGG